MGHSFGLMRKMFVHNILQVPIHLRGDKTTKRKLPKIYLIPPLVSDSKCVLEDSDSLSSIAASESEASLEAYMSLSVPEDSAGEVNRNVTRKKQRKIRKHHKKVKG